MHESIRELTAAIASGNIDSFERFYQCWFDFAYEQARRATGRDESFCLDMVQESMIRVIRSIKPMDDEAALKAWLRAVVHSCCYDELRREQRKLRRERARGLPVDDRMNTDDEQLAWLRSQLALLQPHQAHLLTMRFRLGWTLQRIGRALGLKPGAVDGRISRSIAALRTKAAEDFHDA